MTDDYDRLSPLGVEQSQALGHHWLATGVRPTHAFSGSLQRQRHTAEAIADVFAGHEASFPALTVLEGLNEYPADEIMARLVPQLRPHNAAVATAADAFEAATDKQSQYRHIHRLLEAVIAAWVTGEYDQAGADFPTWAAFSGGVRGALRQIMRDAPSGSHLAVFTSGGPVGIAVQTMLEAPELKAAELNWRVHNAAVTRMTFSGSRVSLDAFNAVEHLPEPMRTFR